ARLYAKAQADDRRGGPRAKPGAEDSGRCQREDRRRSDRCVRIEWTVNAGSFGEGFGRQRAAVSFRHRATGTRPREEETGSVEVGAGRSSDAKLPSDTDPARNATYGIPS